MSRPPTILLVDSSASDRSLATQLLERALPSAAITAVTEPLSLAEALLGGPPDIAIVAADLEWFDVGKLLAAIKQHRPTTAIVLFGVDRDVSAHLLQPGIALDAVVHKSSAGFLALGEIVSEVLARSGRHAASSDAGDRPTSSRSDDELREVTLMFSHDVRQPLQQMIRLARQGQAAGSGEASARALKNVLECAERAGSMLDGMVDYLAVARRAFKPAPVDLNRCLKQALDQLRGAIEEAHAEIRIASLPTTMGDERQLSHLFQNLISNAIKFRGRERPVITVTVERHGDAWLLAFKDNGIGIPEGSLERIFELGTRLHTREEFPGTGIGLALCRRIVERHGGRIWAESRGAGGSTFFVVLPAAPSVPARVE